MPLRDRLRPLLARLSRKRSIGLVVNDERVTVSQAVHTPLGPIEVAHWSEDLGRDSLDAALKRALTPVLESRLWRAASVAVALPSLRLLFAARPLTATNRQASGDALLHEAMQLTNILIDDLAIDTLRVPNRKGGGLATILAARKRYLDPLLEALMSTGVRPHTVEPSAFALLRLAVRSHGGASRGRAVVRAFMGDSMGLLILALGTRPLAWRGFPVKAGAEAAAVAAAAGPLCALSARYGLETPPDALIVHGRGELTGLAADPVWGPLGLQVRHVDGPALSGAAEAFGAAMGCHMDEDGFNLARALRPQPSFASVFPWGQAAIEAGVLAAATGLLGGHVMDVSTQAQLVSSQVAERGWLKGKSVAELSKERDDLKTRAEMVREFLGGRIQWVSYTRELAARMPESMGVTQFDGKNTFVPPGAKGVAVQSLTMAIEARLPPGGTVPAEIDALMQRLRATPLLKANLPVIRMSALKWGVARDRKGAQVASFNLVCTPEPKAKPVGKGKKPAAGAK